MSDWGQGVINNDIEWGRGSTNNDIGWGSSYANSWSGDTALELGFTPESLAFFTSIEDAGGSLSDTVKLEYDAFVKREKSANRWSKIKRLYPFLGGVINSARIDAITLAQATNNNFVDADTDSLIGLKGDGSTKRLLLGATNTLLVENYDWQIYWFSLESTTLDRHVLGTFNGTTGLLSIRKRPSISHIIYGNVISLLAENSTPPSNNLSVFGGRFSNTALEISVDGGSFVGNFGTDSASLPTSEFGLIGRGGSTPQYSNEKSGCFASFNGMTKAEMIAFDASYKTFLTNIGAI